ncbi:low affinity iron permease family protein [Mesorhizobium sp. dw_380]|uniref:low affinity iron permease family protein n=1 Tax=Mesorhizobium sp. dw_380 TaxID=2812001 RepID=UPI001BDE7C97|nr:low affinity iron permease family protein [Mesorhizobium sp. dw_380]
MQEGLLERSFTRMAGAVARATGRPWAFALCVASVILWAALGPRFQYSETWQLIINTGTTIITFLMVFLIQNIQNRDGAAIQAKLDELIRAGRGKNDFIGIEHLTEAEVEEMRALCLRAAKRNQKTETRATAGNGRNGHRHAPHAGPPRKSASATPKGAATRSSSVADRRSAL